MESSFANGIIRIIRKPLRFLAVFFFSFYDYLYVFFSFFSFFFSFFFFFGGGGGVELKTIWNVYKNA